VVFDNQLEIQRIEKKEELRNLGINPYPHFLKKDMNIKEFRDKFEAKKPFNAVAVNVLPLPLLPINAVIFPLFIDKLILFKRVFSL